MKRWLGIGLIGLALLIAACGGDDDGGGGGGTLSLQQYFDRMQTISAETDTAQNALGDPESFEDFANLFGDQADILKDSLDKVDDLNPPSEVKDLHNLFLSGLEDFEKGARDLAGDLDGIDNADDFTEALGNSNFEVIAATFQTACSGLETIAAANNITVDLECGDDDE